MKHEAITVLSLLGALAPGPWNPLFGQCPDGTPPPCARATRPVAAPAVPANGVAVLYFDNLAHDTAYAYLADGVTEELITSLRRVGRLNVPSRNESARIRRAPAQPAASIARQLGVRYLLSGSVQTTGGRLRVNAELLDAGSGRVVWGDRLVVSGSDLLAAQESIAVAVVGAVSGALRPEERRAFARRATRDTLAYDYYLRGRVALSRLSAEAIPLFERALERDPNFALAAAGAAVAWGWMDEAVTPMVAQTQARLLAERALRLDSSVAMAWHALAVAAFQGDQDLDRAAAFARRAIALDSTLAEPHAVLSDVALLQGRPREAAAEFALAWRTDSLSRVVELYRWWQLSIVRDTAGMAQFLDQVERASGPRPRERALLHLTRGECDRAAELFPNGPAEYRAEYVMALACAGRVDTARALLDAMAPADRFTIPTGLAAIALALGDREGALAWLERAAVAREYVIMFVDVDWRWEPLRGEPRFEALRRRIGRAR